MIRITKKVSTTGTATPVVVDLRTPSGRVLPY